MIIGIYGGPASGKSRLCKELKAHFDKLHVPSQSINCDQLAHEIYKTSPEVQKEMKKAFGSDIFAADFSINRELIIERAFNNTTTWNCLNRIIWPMIHTRLDALTNKPKGFISLVDAAVLNKTSWGENYDLIVRLHVDPDVGLKRCRSRCWTNERYNKISDFLCENKNALKRFPKCRAYLNFCNNNEEDFARILGTIKLMIFKIHIKIIDEEEARIKPKRFGLL